MPFYEDFLFYVWQFKVFSQKDLKTVDDQPIKLIHAGILNKNAGPDFEHAKLQIGDTKWAGNVEIHIKSSDWIRHSHPDDKAYNNVILHVVYEYDTPVFRNDGSLIPTLEIKPFIHPDIESQYKILMQNLNWIPCEKHIAQISDLHMESWLLRMLIERLETKSEQVIEILSEYKGSWDDAFYITLARNFGFKTNALPFEMMARSLPQQILARHKNNPLQIEALIFGQAGFLEDDINDDFHRSLANEYRFLKAKYNLKPIDKYLWKFLRLRPQNFPTLRLAQFSALVLQSSHLFSKIVEIKEPKEIRELFKTLPVSPYWLNHYRFGTEAEKVSNQLGASSIDNILLNSIAHTLFTYGKCTDSDIIKNRVISLLEIIPFEENQITQKFIEIGVKKGRSDRSQALLHLKKTYCDFKKCLNCAIGTKLVNPN
ncbi:DUF2851 family protein [Pedobacter sp. P351]|uniref:DUF2851 family protein n=1 Tax=Pedobacter superstes TaxID=3133441 RepID=UPI0030A4882D